MAASRRKRPNSIGNLLGDVLDDTKDLVDDLVDRAKDAESDMRRAARRVVDSRGRSLDDEPDEEIDSLKAALDDLTAKVNRLANLQAEGEKRR
ncbi:MAG TPA: hypothetical protein VNC22_04565 [Sporichthya sp.]|nr:hypothetical protein [Sporichthya sp.]